MINNDKVAVRPDNKREAEELILKLENRGFERFPGLEVELGMIHDKAFSETNNSGDICFAVKDKVIFAGDKDFFVNMGFRIIPYR